MEMVRVSSDDQISGNLRSWNVQYLVLKVVKTTSKSSKSYSTNKASIKISKAYTPQIRSRSLSEAIAIVRSEALSSVMIP